MIRWFIRMTLGLFVFAVVLLVLGWSVLTAPFFSSFRNSLASEVLSKQIGQPLQITEDIRVRLGLVSHFTARGVQIPSENLKDVNLAELANFEFDVNLLSLRKGKIDLNNLLIDGLKVIMLTDAKGTNSWRDPVPRASQTVAKAEEAARKSTKDVAEQSASILSFLQSRTASITRIQLFIDDEVTGFEYDFQIESLNLEQAKSGAVLDVTGRGTVNGQPFTIDGHYPEGAPFTTHATFSAIELHFNGDPIAPSDGGGFVGQLDVDVSAMGDLFDVFKLQRFVDGAAALSAKVTNKAGVMSVSDVSTEVALETGENIVVNGDVGNLADLDGFDIEIIARLFPKNKPPKPAKKLKDLELTGITARILSQDKTLKFDELRVATNAFEQGLDEIAAVSIGQIRRTDDGNLAADDVVLQAGVKDAPMLTAQGKILNILELKQFDLTGKVSAPASLVLSKLGDGAADAFGGINAAFAVDDAQGVPRLVSLTAEAVNSDVWSMNTNVRSVGVNALDTMEIDFDLGIADGASFLSTLKLKAVDTGPLKLSASLRGEVGSVNAKVSLVAGTSEMAGVFAFSEANERTRIDADIVSEKLVMNDLRNGLSGVKELQKINNGTDTTDSEPKAKRDVGPNEIELQPLVLPKEPAKPTDLVDAKKTLANTDVFATVNLKKIIGIKGINNVSSKLVLQNGKAKLGPLALALGGGVFDLQANMDVIGSPEVVAVSGATKGWDLGDILKTLGLKVRADGNLKANFQVVGNRSSVDTFVNSMSGSATIAMSQGQVATSLLELAGLGVFPWLFSKEIRQGYTDIACVVAPVKITPGKVAFDSVVAETTKVQMVAKGVVDWKKDTISVRAEPRRAGRPLARAAWPINISGKLSAPKFKLQVGGSRSRRADGANQMPTDRQPCTPDIRQLE